MCDFRPAIEPEDRKELEKLFYNVHGAAQLLQVLSAAGIYHDGHVAVMRGWTQEQRMMLWEELVARLLKDFAHPNPGSRPEPSWPGPLVNPKRQCMVLLMVSTPRPCVSATLTLCII